MDKLVEMRAALSVAVAAGDAFRSGGDMDAVPDFADWLESTPDAPNQEGAK